MDNNIKGNITHSGGLAAFDFFKYRAELEIQRGDRMEAPFSLAVLHFDTPKINGVIYPKNILTTHISEAITSTIRNIDIACIDQRQDFLILLTDTTNELAENISLRIYNKLNFTSHKEIESKVSIGIANYPEDYKSYEELVQAAKFAMFQVHQKQDLHILSTTTIRKGLTWHKEATTALNSTKKKFNNVIESTIKSLLSTFSRKDVYLERHSLEVARIASLFAEDLGLKDSYIQEITFASLLHDIGYLEISNDILYKPGSLSKEERSIIETHSKIATNKILKPVKSFENILPIIEDHHESWDGSGYPNKKAGRDIHIGARILSIADVYQALCSQRPYRKALSHEDALNIIAKNAGIRWDNKLVESFIELAGSDEFQKEISKDFSV